MSNSFSQYRLSAQRFSLLFRVTFLSLAVWAIPPSTLAETAGADAVFDQTSYRFQIPPQDLTAALNSFADTAKIQLSFPAELASGKTSPGLNGLYPPLQALNMLLDGSGLNYRVTANKSITLQRNDTAQLGQLLAAHPLENFMYAAAEQDEANNDQPLAQEDMTVLGARAGSLTSGTFADSQVILNSVPGGTTLISGDRIREGANNDVSDTLSYVPGLYIGTTSGSIGNGTRISTRGSDVNSAISPILGVKLLRDGIPFTNANGATDTESINLYAIDRIEVYRGANAMQYGAAQLGGAINIISPTGYTAEGLKLSVTAGSYDFVNPTVSFGKVFDNGLDIYGSFAFNRTDTFRDGGDQEHFFGYGNIGYRWDADNETRFHFDIQDHDYAQPNVLTRQQLEQDPNQNSNPTDPKSGFPMYRFALQHSTRLDDDDRIDVGAYYFQKEFCFPCKEAGLNNDDWFETGFNARHVYHYQLFGMDSQLTYGGLWQIMWIEDRKSSRSENEDYFNQELFAENKLTLNDQLTFVLGLQSVYRDNENHRTMGTLNFGTVDYTSTDGRASKDYYGFNPKAGLIWDFAPDIQIYGNISRSWEQPRVRQLQNFAQDPAIKDQTATTLEIGARGSFEYLNWDLSVYNAWVDDEILVVESPPLSQNYITGNAEATLHTGLELGLESTLPLDALTNGDTVRFRGTYTWNHFRFDDDPSFGNNQLPGIPEHLGRFEFLYRHPSGFSIGPNVQAVSSNWVDFANTLKADSYALVGLRAAYDTNAFRVFVEGRNLTDEHYASSVYVMADAEGMDQAQFNPGPTTSVFGGFELRW